MASYRRRGNRWQARVRRVGLKDLVETFETKARAQAWATQREAEILAGRRGEFPNKTLADALDKYLAEESPKKLGLRWEKIRIEAFKRSTMASKRLSVLTEADIAQWRNDRLKAVSGATVRREMGLLGSILDVARREWRWLAANPMSDVSKPGVAAPRRRGVPAGACGAISSNLGGPFGTQVILAFALAIETAMRRGEILGLTWQQISGSVARLPKTKNGDARAVALSGAALAILEEQKGLHPVQVFTVDPASADALFRKAVKKAGLTDLHFHDSRSEAITRLSKKLDVLELARMVGHRDLKSLLIYYAPSAEDMAKKLG